jgi:hypothetical protein
MSPPRTLAATLIGSALLVTGTGTGCQANPPATQGSTVNTDTAQMPDLPKDPDAAEALVRTMLMKEAIVLLKTAGLKYTHPNSTSPAPTTKRALRTGTC